MKLLKKYIPNCGLSSDIICGFCEETQEDFNETLSLIEKVKFDSGYMFYYSNREGTFANKKLNDNVPLKIKKQRLQKVINKQRENFLASNKNDVGKIFEVLIENYSKKSNKMLFGRNEQYKGVIIPINNHKIGDFVNVKITNYSAATLFGETV